ncbi:hypothetical protein IC582_016453 [Cucumis melo]
MIVGFSRRRQGFGRQQARLNTTMASRHRTAPWEKIATFERINCWRKDHKFLVMKQ